MDMDIPKLAAETAALLAPFLPYLIKGGKIAAKAAFEETGKKFVDSVWDKAEELWGRLKPKVKANASAQSAIEKAARKPDDPRVLGNLEVELEEIFEQDISFAESIKTGNYSVAIGGNVEGKNIAIGTQPQAAETIINNNFYDEKIPTASVSIEQLTQEYLHALVADCEKLPLGSIHVTLEKAEHEASISLEDVYIDLDVRPRAREEKEMQAEEREPQRTPIIEALADEKLRRVVLLGEAGSGKTTCVHYLTIALSSIHQNITTKKPLPAGSTLARYFPIRLILRDVTIPTDRKTCGVDILWNALRGDLTKKIGREQADLLFPHLQKRIKTTPCLIMLDGLDEVPESEERRQRLLEAIEHFAAPLKQSIVVVTARPYTYDNPKWHLPHFEILDLLNFSSEQIKSFISRFYESVQVVKNWDNTLVELRKSGLNEAVQSREYLHKLAERPLLLTLITSVDSSGSQLPEDRAELYKQTIDLLLQRWHLRKESSVAEQEIVKFFSTDASKVLGILQKLSYKVHERQGRESKPKEDAPADIDKDEIWGAFSHSLPKDIDIDSLLNFLEKRAGLLLDRGEGIYIFPHRSFQEYLAAGFLNTQSDEKFHFDTIFRSGPKWWHEVVLLGIARMSGSLKNAADEVNSLVPCDIEEMEQKITPTDWQVATLAGQALLEMRLKEKGGDQVKYKTIIKRVANWLAQLLEQNALTPRERAEAGNILAKLGDLRIGITNDFLFCEVPSGKFMMGSQKDEKDSSDSEYPQFEYNIPYNYLMSRYPITNAQFDLFLKDPNGYANEEWWTKAGLAWRKNRAMPDKHGGVFDLSNHPMVYVRWYEADSFTHWLAHQLNTGGLKLYIWNKNKKDKITPLTKGRYEVRLPTEAEWEHAAHDGRHHRYPWNSDEINPNYANYADTQIGATSTVGAFPQGMNDYGLLDISGNVWEWCVTEWQENYKEYLKKENNNTEGSDARVLRGGAYIDYDWRVRCTYRRGGNPGSWSNLVGFRVVVSSVSR
jgi:formylglycine-generating enzyme required for sulfatase activity